MENTHIFNEYIAGLFALQDEALIESLAEMKRENVPGMNVSGTEGQLLHLFALLVGAKRILEIGTLGGYSGIHLARALPDNGQLVTLELDPHHAEVARRNFERADVSSKVELRLGPASQSLEQLARENGAPFDLVFIDADKEGYVDYLRLSLPLLREGGLLLADNTLRHIDSPDEHPTKLYNSAVAARPELQSVIVPVLRHRGIDGLTVSVKRTVDQVK